MIETLTAIAVGFLSLFAIALAFSIVYFLVSETNFFPAILVLAFWGFVAYHLGKAVLSFL